jgi:hypothetical protein
MPCHESRQPVTALRKIRAEIVTMKNVFKPPVVTGIVGLVAWKTKIHYHVSAGGEVMRAPRQWQAG